MDPNQRRTARMREPTHEVTPDGTHVFEIELEDGTRAVATILPEDIDEVAGPATQQPPPDAERKRRFQVARLMAEMELKRQLEEH